MSDHAQVPEGPVVLFDGVCNLCNGVVRFVVPRDEAGQVRFAALQSDAGQALLRAFDLPTGDFDSFVLVDDGEYYTKSAAALRLASYLDGPVSWLAAFGVLPRPVRDAVYDLVAAHRYRVFGRKEQCMVPTPDLEARFLEDPT
jgi:predicted DCC family thiol-disulfide oxidoreductase YuxK